TVYDLGLRFLAARARVRHIPAILYHRALGSVAANGPGARRRALARYFESVGVAAAVEPGSLPHLHRVRFALPRTPLVSIVIPCAGAPTHLAGTSDYHLARCIASIRRHSGCAKYEILAIHDGELPDDLTATL